MTDKEKRQLRRDEEDAVFNRMLIWMIGVVAAEAVVLFVKRFYIDVTPSDFGVAAAMFLNRFFNVFMILGLVLAVLGAIWCIRNQKVGRSLLAPAILTVAVLFLWLLSVLGRLLYDTGIKIMVALPIVAAVLILIYFLYQRAFFVNAVLSGCGMAVLWCFRQFYDLHSVAMYALFAIGWVILAVLAALAYVLKKHDGKLGTRQIVHDQNSYPACWLTCAVVALTTVLALILGSSAAFYLIYALIGWLFCLAVYYTVKLI